MAHSSRSECTLQTAHVRVAAESTRGGVQEALLAPDGRLYLIVGDPPMMEALIIVRGQNSEWYGNSMFETEIPALISGRQDAAFTF